MSLLVQDVPQVQRAADILHQGRQHEGSRDDQLLDVMALAEAASCPHVLEWMMQHYRIQSVTPSGIDRRVFEAIGALEDCPVPEAIGRGLALEGHRVLKLALAAGCHDIYDDLIAYLPDVMK